MGKVDLPYFGKIDRTTFWVFFSAFAVRVFLTIYGEWHDRTHAVKYTDIDYGVFSDAGREIMEGNTPFDRATYRYTPLLAWMTIPNIWFRPFGKFMFCLIDMLIGVLTFRILRMRGLTAKNASIHSSWFLLSPITINVSTRGNADSIVCALVVLSMYLLMKKRIFVSAIFFGLAVHFKIYPIIYALPLVLFLDDSFAPGDFPVRHYPTLPQNASFQSKLRLQVRKAMYWVIDFITWKRVMFGLVSGSVFLVLLAVFYRMYGFQFLWETYLYHSVRSDNRHNFSPYFYDLYLRYDLPTPKFFSLLSSLPQFGTAAAVGVLYYQDLPFCLFLQTLVFVAFNKVVTAQYFHWYMCLIPLMTPQTRLGFHFEWIAQRVSTLTPAVIKRLFKVPKKSSNSATSSSDVAQASSKKVMNKARRGSVVDEDDQQERKDRRVRRELDSLVSTSGNTIAFSGETSDASVIMRVYTRLRSFFSSNSTNNLHKAVVLGLLILGWLSTELSWNFWAYWLEIRGQATFLYVWIAGLLFFIANVVLAVAIVRHHTFKPVFRNGRLVMMNEQVLLKLE